MTLRALIFTIALTLCGCASLPPITHAPPPPPPTISRERADEIASAYFQEYMGDCGGTNSPVWMDGKWQAFYDIGFSGERGPHPIIVSGYTGTVSCFGYPTLTKKALLQKK